MAEVLEFEELDLNVTWPIHPVPDRLHSTVALPQPAEFVGRQLQQAVRLAIAAGIDVAHHLGRKTANGHFFKLRRIAAVMPEIHDHGIRQRKPPRLGAQTACTGCR